MRGPALTAALLLALALPLAGEVGAQTDSTQPQGPGVVRQTDPASRDQPAGQPLPAQGQPLPAQGQPLTPQTEAAPAPPPGETAPGTPGLAAPAAAPADTAKEALTNDPNVRQSQEPGNTVLGRNPPNTLTTDSDIAFQQAIDRAHEGAMGVTRDGGGTRRPPNQPPELADGSASRPSRPPQ